MTQFDLIDNENRNSFFKAIKRAHGLLGASVKFTEEMLTGVAHLEAISTISVGYDNFDVPWLTERGIILSNTPDVLTETVADTIFVLMLASARRVVELAEFVKAGHWRQSIDETLYGVDVHSKTLGILGMGRIGTAVARRVRLGFNMEVLYYNRSRNPEVEDQFNAKFSTFDDILGAADFLCVVLPLTKETEKLIGAPEFAKTKRGAIFLAAFLDRWEHDPSLDQLSQLAEDFVFFSTATTREGSSIQERGSKSACRGDLFDPFAVFQALASSDCLQLRKLRLGSVSLYVTSYPVEYFRSITRVSRGCPLPLKLLTWRVSGDAGKSNGKPSRKVFLPQRLAHFPAVLQLCRSGLIC